MVEYFFMRAMYEDKLSLWMQMKLDSCYFTSFTTFPSLHLSLMVCFSNLLAFPFLLCRLIASKFWSFYFLPSEPLFHPLSSPQIPSLVVCKTITTLFSTELNLMVQWLIHVKLHQCNILISATSFLKEINALLFLWLFSNHDPWEIVNKIPEWMMPWSILLAKVVISHCLVSRSSNHIIIIHQQTICS